MMDVELFREFCLSKSHATEDFPFDAITLCFRIEGKIFATIPLDSADRANLKCFPAYAEELREKYTGVRPGFHMNKKHWNTVMFFEDLDDATILHLVNHSYDQVVSKLPLNKRKELKQ